MQMYVNYYDREVKLPEPLGIKVSVPLLSGCPWVEQSSPSQHQP
jgi:hypothetical protein